jgi:hypothetical protein
MTPQDKIPFVQGLLRLSLFYNKSLSLCVLELYWHTLKHLDFSVIQAALQAHTQDPDRGQFMPKPADIVFFIEHNAESQSLQAWAEVLEKIRRCGSYETVVFEDRSIHAVIHAMGGWIALCRKTEREMLDYARVFHKTYCYYQRHLPAEKPLPLLGRFAG